MLNLTVLLVERWSEYDRCYGIVCERRSSDTSLVDDCTVMLEEVDLDPSICVGFDRVASQTCRGVWEGETKGP
jgi:hypothetical protein